MFDQRVILVAFVYIGKAIRRCCTSIQSRGGGGGGLLPYIGRIWVCATGEGMVFKPFVLVEGMVFKPFGVVKGLVIIENWYSIGSRLTGSLTKD